MADFPGAGHNHGSPDSCNTGIDDYWIDVWKDYDPIVVYLEDMEKLEGFPHENKTSGRREYPKITDGERKLIAEALTWS